MWDINILSLSFLKKYYFFLLGWVTIKGEQVFTQVSIYAQKI